MSPEMRWLLSRLGRHILLRRASGLPELNVLELEKRWTERGRVRRKLLPWSRWPR